MVLLADVYIHVVMGSLLFFTSIFMIFLVLIQRGRGGGLAGALGGGGGGSAFGAKAGDTFTWVTYGVALFWFLLCILTIFLMQGPRRVRQDVTNTDGPSMGATAPADENGTTGLTTGDEGTGGLDTDSVDLPSTDEIGGDLPELPPLPPANDAGTGDDATTEETTTEETTGGDATESADGQPEVDPTETGEAETGEPETGEPETGEAETGAAETGGDGSTGSDPAATTEDNS